MEKSEMRKKVLAYCFIAFQILIQILGGLFYDQIPQFVWPLSNAILILMPIVFGMGLGLLCFLPVIISEIVWFCILHAAGPLLHLASFAVSIVILAFAYRYLKRAPHLRKALLSGILYEVFLFGEEALYYALRLLFLHRPIRWADVSGTLLSLANPLLLIVLVVCCIGNGKDEQTGS